MAVVAIKKRRNSKKFDVLAVPISREVKKTYSYKSGKSELNKDIKNEKYHVYIFHPHICRDTKVIDAHLVKRICEYMPGYCGDEGHTCPHRWECIFKRKNVDDIDWKLIPSC